MEKKPIINVNIFFTRSKTEINSEEKPIKNRKGKRKLQL